MKQIDNFFSLIITAAGNGSRFDHQKKKQFCEINNVPILFHTIDIFYSINEIDDIIITLPEDDLYLSQNMIKQKYPKITRFISGGDTRQKSIYNALQHCKKNDFVIIHDAVRPFIEHSDLIQMMEIAKIKNAVIPGSKVKNTIKKVKNDIIEKTISRDCLIEVFTPQIFNLKLLKEYHQKALNIEQTFTDDASILEYFNEPVHWYDMKNLNIKITTKDDLLLAEYLLSKRRENYV